MKKQKVLINVMFTVRFSKLMEKITTLWHLSAKDTNKHVWSSMATYFDSNVSFLQLILTIIIKMTLINKFTLMFLY